MRLRGVAIGSFLVLMAAISFGPLAVSGCSSANSGTGSIPMSGTPGGGTGASTTSGDGNGGGGSSVSGAATAGQVASGATTGANPSGATAGQVASGATTGSNASGANASGANTSGAATGTASGQVASGASGSSSGAGSSTTDGGRPSGPSGGCGQPPPNAEPIGTAVLHNIDITGMAQEYVAGYTHRLFCTTMPKGYDPTMPYPVVFYGPGCGATGCEGSSFTGRTDIIYVEAISSADAKEGTTPPTLVPPDSSPGCFQTGRESTVDSPELPYFDAVMAQVQANYCTDKGRVFAAGTSSGGWLSNYLGCARGNVIRGIAADSGGIPVARPTCTGGAAAMEFPGDSAVTQDDKGNQIGVSVARDLFIQQNGCSMTPTNMTFGTANCQFYGGCTSPVVWCNTGGAHQAGDTYLSPSGWAFWSTLQ